MSEHFNRLTPAEAERLALLAEECAEVQQIVCKILRHGYEDHHPEHQTTNRSQLEVEAGHLIAALGRMMAENDIQEDSVHREMVAKALTGGKWLHHQEDSK